MQLPIDERILEVLSHSGLVPSPTIIVENINKSRGEVNRRLLKLVGEGLIPTSPKGEI